jgi:hypothetical protein
MESSLRRSIFDTSSQNPNLYRFAPRIMKTCPRLRPGRINDVVHWTIPNRLGSAKWTRNLNSGHQVCLIACVAEQNRLGREFVCAPVEINTPYSPDHPSLVRLPHKNGASLQNGSLTIVSLRYCSWSRLRGSLPTAQIIENSKVYHLQTQRHEDIDCRV